MVALPCSGAAARRAHRARTWRPLGRGLPGRSAGAADADFAVGVRLQISQWRPGAPAFVYVAPRASRRPAAAADRLAGPRCAVQLCRGPIGRPRASLRCASARRRSSRCRLSMRRSMCLDGVDLAALRAKADCAVRAVHRRGCAPGAGAGVAHPVKPDPAQRGTQVSLRAPRGLCGDAGADRRAA